jgi:hypothetical protein
LVLIDKKLLGAQAAHHVIILLVKNINSKIGIFPAVDIKIGVLLGGCLTDVILGIHVENTASRVT